jgi:hypothetical protein
MRAHLLRHIRRRHGSWLPGNGVRFLIPFSRIYTRFIGRKLRRFGGRLDWLRSCSGSRHRDVGFRFERQGKQREMLCLGTHLEQIRIFCHRQIKPNGLAPLQSIILNCKRAGPPGIFLPFCPGQFETYLERRREDNLGNSPSFQILKLHLNYLWTTPYRIFGRWI